MNRNLESLYVLRNLISIHSMLNNAPGLQVKQAINKAIIETACWFQSEISAEEFEKHILTNDWVYCWTKDKIEYLNKIGDVILCTSKEINSFNKDYDLFTSRKYKYHYKLHIKQNCFGLYLNTFNYKISKKDKLGYAYNGAIHLNEQEVLLQLKDIDIYELLK